MKEVKIFAVLTLLALAAACTSPARQAPSPWHEFGGTNYTGQAVIYVPGEEEEPGEDEDFVGVAYGQQQVVHGDAVITVASRRFALGRNAAQKQMDMFSESMDAAYAAARRAYRPLGFTYALSMLGSVNPMSDIEVQCILSEESAQEIGPQTCSLFFAEIKNNYDNLTSGETAPKI